MKASEIKNKLAKAVEAENKAFDKAMESASEEDMKKYESLLEARKKLDREYEEAVALEEKEGEKTPSTLQEDKPKTLTEEAIEFGKKLVEAVQKGTAFNNLIPQEVAAQIQMKKEKIAKLRGYCTVHQASGDYVVYVEGDDVVVNYVSEATAITDSTPTIKPVALKALKLGALVKVSREYIEDLAVDVIGYITDKMAKAFAKKEDNEILFGGATTNTIRGITTNTSVPVTSGALTWANVKAVIDALEDYQDNCVLVMNHATANAIKEFKDGDKYIFDQDRPLTQIWGHNIITMKDMPKAESGNIAIVAGDFSYYHICDRTSMSIAVLNELYAETDQVGIKGIERIDGDLALAEAFSVLTIA